MPTIGGKIISISGGIFHSFTANGRFGYTDCESTSWIASTSIICLVAAGVNSEWHGSVVVTSGSAVGSLTEAATYDAPISALTPSNVKLTSDIVLIMGVDLGLMDSTLQGRFSLSSAESSTWFSDTLVLCLSNSGISSTLSVFVTIARVVDTLSQALSYDGPKIASVVVHQKEMKISWSVAGKNFGVNALSPSSRLGFSQALATRWLSDSSIFCQSSGNHLAIRLIAVTSGQLVGSLTNANVHVGFGVLAVVPSNHPIWISSLLQVAGKGFGLNSFSGSVRLGHSASQLTEWVSDSIIICKTSPGSSGQSVAAFLVVTISRAKISLSGCFSYDTMSLSSVQASNLRAWSSMGISLFGASWGESGLSPRVRVGASDTLSTVWISDTFVLCKLLPGYHVHPQVVATLSGYQGTLFQSLSYDLPSILLTQAIRSQRESEMTDWNTNGISIRCKQVNHVQRVIVQRAFMNRVVIIKNSIALQLGTFNTRFEEMNQVIGLHKPYRERNHMKLNAIVLRQDSKQFQTDKHMKRQKKQIRP